MIFLLACTSSVPTIVTLSGTVYDAPYLQGDIVAGEALTTLDVSGTSVGTATSGSDGTFSMDAPAGGPFFLELSGDHPPTTFSGTTGYVDLDAGVGVPWIATQTWVDRLRSDFSACPSAQDEGAVAVGEVRIYVDGVAPWDSPTAGTASLKVTGSDGTAVLTCVLDDDGNSVDYGDTVGSTGRFAAFGLPEGPLVVGLSYVDGAGNTQTGLYRGLVADGGVAPFYPLFVSAASGATTQ